MICRASDQRGAPPWVVAFSLTMAVLGAGRADAFTYYVWNGVVVTWPGGTSVRFLSP